MKPKPNIAHVHLLYGPEDFLIHQEVQRLLDLTLSQKERGFNFHLFNGQEHSSQEILQTAQSLPMFSQYRFVLINESDHMDEKKIEALMKYIPRPSPTTCLVLCGQTIGSWRAYRKEIEKVGRVIEFTRLKGKALVTWMKNRMSEKGKTLTEEAANYLMEIVGDSLYDIDNALEKAFLSVGDKRRIDLSDVEEITSNVKISTVFDLTDAIGHRNLEKALDILEKAMESGSISFRKEEDPSKKKQDPVPLLLSMMAKQYWSLLMIKEMAARHKEPGGLAEEVGTSLWMVKKWMEQGKNFSKASLREGIMRCHQTDLAVKRSRGPKHLLMEKLVIDLCRPDIPPLSIRGEG